MYTTWINPNHRKWTEGTFHIKEYMTKSPMSRRTIDVIIADWITLAVPVQISYHNDWYLDAYMKFNLVSY